MGWRGLDANRGSLAVSYHLTIFGAPRTKKNHGSVIQRGKRRFHIPSAAWTAWVRAARIEAYEQWGTPGCIPLGLTVNCRALFYRDADRGDAVGYYQGLADLLETRGVVANDRLIVSWDGSRMLKDTANPRVEVTLEVEP
jgi:hypothetical protein